MSAESPSMSDRTSQRRGIAGFGWGKSRKKSKASAERHRSSLNVGTGVSNSSDAFQPGSPSSTSPKFATGHATPPEDTRDVSHDVNEDEAKDSSEETFPPSTIELTEDLTQDEEKDEYISDDDDDDEDNDDGSTKVGRSKETRKLLQTVDRLRTLLESEGDLRAQMPKIVVIGDQSHGKSSVLEALSGVDLPRKDGTCTRLALEMYLWNQSKDNPEYALIGMRNGGPMKRIELSEISQAIEKLTEANTEDEDEIGEKAIKLEVFRRHQNNLTLIDLPGMTRFGKGKHKDKDVATMIKDLYMRYISDPNTVILSVTFVSTDLDNSESVKLAYNVDKSFGRTIVVLSKIDKEASDDELHKRYQVAANRVGRQSVIFVRNRTGEENEKGLSLLEARRREIEFFETRKLVGVPAMSKGMKKLSQMLVKLQNERIRKYIPRLRGEIVKRLRVYREKKKELGGSLRTENEYVGAFEDLIKEWFARLETAILGTPFRRDLKDESFVQNLLKDPSQNVSEQEITEACEKPLCSRILDEMNDLKNALDEICPTESMSTKKYYHYVERQMANHVGGQSLPNEIHPAIPLKVIWGLVSAMGKPCEDLAETIHNLVQDEVVRCGSVLFEEAFPRLWEQLIAIVDEQLRSALEVAQTTARDILRWEYDSPFTLDETYHQTWTYMVKYKFGEEKRLLATMMNRISEDASSDSEADKKSDSEKLDVLPPMIEETVGGMIEDLKHQHYVGTEGAGTLISVLNRLLPPDEPSDKDTIDCFPTNEAVAYLEFLDKNMDAFQYRREVVTMMIKCFCFNKILKRRCRDMIPIMLRSKIAVQPITKTLERAIKEAIRTKDGVYKLKKFMGPGEVIQAQISEYNRRIENLEKALKATASY